MVDTQRTKSALATLFADNSSGDISPQDLRDFLETMHLDYGVSYISSSAETTIATVDVFVKAAGTTTSIPTRNFTHNTGRLTYNGTPTITAFAVCSFSMTAASNSKEIDFEIAQNGTVIANSLIRRKVGTGTDIGAASVQAFIPALATNDYIELWVANHTDNTNVTVELCHLMVVGLFA